MYKIQKPFVRISKANGYKTRKNFLLVSNSQQGGIKKRNSV